MGVNKMEFSISEKNLVNQGNNGKSIFWKPESNKSFSLNFKINAENLDNCESYIEFKENTNNILNVYVDNDVFNFALFTDADKEAFVINAPVKSAEYLLTYNGYNFKIYVDGLLYDEEWPFGDISKGEFSIALWDLETLDFAKVSDEYLNEFQVEEIYKPTQEMKDILFGKQKAHMQYFQPLGNQVFAGDCMPYFHDGVFHLFYLFDRRHHRSKKGFGAHQWAHVSTKDLKNWEEHPIALGVTEETEGSICTGSIIEKDGKFYAFYAKRDTTDRREKVTYAVGDTLKEFVKTDRFVYDFPSPPYVKGPGRDPFVYKGEDGKYHMLVTTRMEDEFTGNKGGCLAHLISEDLLNWVEAEPILPGYSDDPECADYFKFNDFYYIIFSNEGVAKYRMSKNLDGPWLSPKVDTFDVPACRVMKTAAFHNNRRIGASFLEKDFGHFGGNVIFREILQNEDGTLYTSIVPELEPKEKQEIIPKYTMGKNAEKLSEDIKIEAIDGFGAVKLDGLSHNYRITGCIETAGRFFGISVRNSKVYSDGYEVKFDLVQKTVQSRESREGYWKDNNKNTLNCSDISLEKFAFSLSIYDDIVDLSIDGKRSLAARIDNREGNAAYIYAHCAELKISNLKIFEI